jgi:hypothetical protein
VPDAATVMTYAILFFGLFFLFTGLLACVRVPIILFALLHHGRRGIRKGEGFRFYTSLFLMLPALLLGLAFMLSILLMARDLVLDGGGVNGLSEVGMSATILVPLYLILEALCKPFAPWSRDKT